MQSLEVATTFLDNYDENSTSFIAFLNTISRLFIIKETS